MLAYIPISSQTRQIVPFKVENTRLELQDYDTAMLDAVTRININNIFRLKKQEVMPYEKEDNTWLSVTIERNLDIMHYERSVYTMLELISDVGGFNGALILLLALLSQIWNFNNFDNFMVTRLFKIMKPKKKIDENLKFFEQSDYIVADKYPYFLECFRSFAPKKCHFCKLTRREKALLKARDKLDKEINIIEIVKSWRYYEQAIRYLLPEAQRLDLKARSRYEAVDPDLDAVKTLKNTFALKIRRSISRRRHEFSDGFFSSESDYNSAAA